MKITILILAVHMSTMSNGQWQYTNPVSDQMNCVAAAGNTVYAGRAGGGVEGSTDNANTWSNCCYNGMSYSYIWDLLIDGSNVFAATGSGIYVSSDSADNWIPKSSGLVATTPFDTAVFDIIKKDSDLFAATGGEGIFRSSNYGNSWTAVNTGLTNQSVRSLATDGVNLYAGTAGAGVFISSNNGGTWVAASTGLTNGDIKAITVHGSDIFVGTAGDGVFISSNYGGNWSSVNVGLLNLDITSLLAIGSNMFTGTNGGGVYLSTDNGVSWTAINSGLISTNISGLSTNGNHLYTSIYLDGIWKRDLSQIVDISEPESETSFSISPIPFSTLATIEVNRPLSNADLWLYNAAGQIVAHQSHIFGTSIDIQRNALSPGLYCVHLLEKNRQPLIRSIMVSD